MFLPWWRYSTSTTAAVQHSQCSGSAALSTQRQCSAFHTFQHSSNAALSAPQQCNSAPSVAVDACCCLHSTCGHLKVSNAICVGGSVHCDMHCNMRSPQSIGTRIFMVTVTFMVTFMVTVAACTDACACCHAAASSCYPYHTALSTHWHAACSTQLKVIPTLRTSLTPALNAEQPGLWPSHPVLTATGPQRCALPWQVHQHVADLRLLGQGVADGLWVQAVGRVKLTAGVLHGRAKGCQHRCFLECLQGELRMSQSPQPKLRPAAARTGVCCMGGAAGKLSTANDWREAEHCG